MLKYLTQLNPLIYGFLVACFAVIIYVSTDAYKLEEHFGLDTLFRLRGIAAAPAEVAVIAMEKSSSDALQVANNPIEWPRNVHAQLLKKLQDAGATSVSFDVFFKKPRNNSHDTALANAMNEMQNVMLVSQIHRDIQGPDYSPTATMPQLGINIETVIPPLKLFADSVVAVAPFVLPKYPAKVTKFWTYRVSAGDIPNLPAVTLQFYCQAGYNWLRQQLQNDALLTNHSPIHLPEFADMLQQHSLITTMTTLRSLFNRDKLLAQHLHIKVAEDTSVSAAIKQQVKALIALYSGPHRYYLNFYGPPWTIKTIPYQKALTLPPEQLDLRDRAVFVGFSERLQPEQKDNINTVYSQPNGLDLSGVEIAATAFANLLHQRTVTPLAPNTLLVLVFCYGLIIGILSRSLKPTLAISLCLIIAATYMFYSAYMFAHGAQWIPWVVPELFVTPVTLFLAVSWHYYDAYHDRQRIRNAFGLYVPDNVISEISKQGNADEPYQKVMYGVALATDAEQYTNLAETMHPANLSKLMNQYYELLFRPIRNQDGIICDVVGDAMMAIWSSHQASQELRQKALRAAYDITQSLGNNKSEEFALPTRIGLHAGEIALTNVGAIDHYEYRAVGDIVNTASRIESFNKQLGTRCLASDEVIKGTTGILYRALGTFTLAGKKQPIELYEIITTELLASDADHELCQTFASGVAAYQNGNIQDANGIFTELNQRFPADGPTQFYVELCQHADESLSREPHWSSVITINTK